MIDAESGQPVGWTTVVIEGLERARTSDAEGHFFFANVPPGAHVLQSLHVGYHEARFKVEVVAGDTTHVDLAIGHESLHMETIVVEGETESALAPLQEPEVVFSGSKLRQNLSRTIAETIDYEPGIAQRSMGPAPARPVLRGLGGDRLLVVEDGERTGDLS
ncbi:MAG: carboxypeptidase-like regulatory domain-containing protein, partial [Gemmatimonadetes bacterium]|nr:carboxypeptidase-like regulatory domain-containing protein [Gemmatimonadota bacterium]